ncbi:MAG: hypothetical protein VX246_03540 [Myxococcota bacterium]|nr:hypothetical protein [Myxococcota bacterium]
MDGLRETLASRHMRFGWLLIFTYILLGLMLEVMHGFKAAFYLDVENEARRLVWTLAHTHGTLIGVLNLLFGYGVERLSLSGSLFKTASRCFIAAGVLMPLGFFLGGIVVYSGDPGLPILLAPVGGALLVVAVAITAFGAVRGAR